MTRRYWNINLEEMMEAGVHFGHGTRKWNPRMSPYISEKCKGIHIINFTRTARFLSEACDLVFDSSSRGKQFLIVGTKNKAADSVARAAMLYMVIPILSEFELDPKFSICEQKKRKDSLSNIIPLLVDTLRGFV